MKKDKTERRYGSFWKCLNCEGQPEFEHAEMMTHLKETHGIDTKTTKGTKSTVMHLDGDTWSSWDYEWQIGDVNAIQHTCTKRDAHGIAMRR